MRISDWSSDVCSSDLRESTTWPQLCRAGMIGVSILAAGQGDLCRQLADKDKGKRWQGVDAGRTRAGAIFIRDAALSLECAVHVQSPAGDHEIIDRKRVV